MHNRTVSFVVHWDGKSFPDLIGKAKVDREDIIVSSNGTSKFFGAPKISPATGENIANAVYETLTKWNIVNRVEGMCFDTTSTNSGANADFGRTTNLSQIDEVRMSSSHLRNHVR